MNREGIICDQESGDLLTIVEGGNLYIGLEAFSEVGTLDSLDSDWIRVASFVYAADLAVFRLEREHHLRSISLTIPVVNFDRFERLKPVIEGALDVLSHDNWTLSFQRIEGDSPAWRTDWPEKANSTLMFSGGLDSFSGAAHLLASQDEITLVSHINRNRPVKTAQSTLAAAVAEVTGKRVEHLQITVGGRNHHGLSFPDKREETQRTRSMLFVALSSVAARLTGSKRVIVMAENGQFAIHLPLSEARVGSFSTHTAHPEFLQLMQGFLREYYECPDLDVENPYLYKTKGEVVELIPAALRDSIPHSTSCWMTSRIKESHCGICVPCLSRRIALETHDIHLSEYNRDLLREDVGSLDEHDQGKRNLMDLCQFTATFDGPAAIASADELSMHLPELLNPALDLNLAIGMYRRFARQAHQVLAKYPGVSPLLS